MAVNNQSTVAAQEHYTTGSVTSKDGTTIGYRQLGHGPGVVLLHGMMSSGQNHMQLAEALADADFLSNGSGCRKDCSMLATQQ